MADWHSSDAIPSFPWSRYIGQHNPGKQWVQGYARSVQALPAEDLTEFSMIGLLISLFEAFD